MRTAGRYLRITERSSPLVKVSGTTDFIELRRCGRFYGRALMVLQPESGRLEQPRCGPADSAICVMNGSRRDLPDPCCYWGWRACINDCSQIASGHSHLISEMTQEVIAESSSQPPFLG